MTEEQIRQLIQQLLDIVKRVHDGEAKSGDIENIPAILTTLIALGHLGAIRE